MRTTTPNNALLIKGRFALPFVVVLSLMCMSLVLSADNLRTLNNAVFSKFEHSISELESETESEAIAKEIEHAKRLIRHGKLLTRAGRTKKAAVFAERLQFQIELIRALIETTDAVHALSTTEKEILEMELKLKMLKRRLERLSMEAADEKPTGVVADPVEKDNAK